MAEKFFWDLSKAVANLAKHRVSFEEAKTVFGDPFALTRFDPAHSEAEDRFLTLGFSTHGRLLLVSHCEVADGIRLISARLAAKKEALQYATNSKRR